MMELEPAAALAEQPTQARAVAATPQSHDDVLFMAMQRGFSTEQISQLMDLRDRQDRHVAEKAFRDCFAAFRGENIIVPKTKGVDRGKAGSFIQAEYHVVANMLSPALSRHGFGFRHDQKFGTRRVMTEGVESDIGWVWVTCFLEHRAGHSERLDLEGPQGDLSANTPTQNMQVTASYLKRQSLLAITGTATGGEDDENKMRGKGGEGDPAEDELLQAGKEAAKKGMVALTKWWGALTPNQRSAYNGDFGAMRKTAAAADAGGSNA
jgi:hypothetical protein